TKPSISSASHDFVCSIAPSRIPAAVGCVQLQMVWQKFDDDCHRCQHLSREVGSMNEQTNTTDQSQNHEESAYSLLIRSEEKSRNGIRARNVSLLDSGPVHPDLAVRTAPGSHSATGVKRP